MEMDTRSGAFRAFELFGQQLLQAGHFAQSSECQAEVSATSILESGRRHLLLKEIPNVVSVLPEACKLFSEKYGDKAIERSEGIDLEKAKVKNSSTQVVNLEGFSRDEKHEDAKQVAKALEENIDIIDKTAKAHYLHDKEDADMEDEEEEKLEGIKEVREDLEKAWIARRMQLDQYLELQLYYRD